MQWKFMELFSESNSGELIVVFDWGNFEGLSGTEQTTDCYELVYALVVVAFVVTVCSFSEQCVLFERHVPI